MLFALSWRLLALAVLGYHGQVSTASSLPESERCVTAAYTALNYLSFAEVPELGYWETRCRNALKVTSIYAASETYCRGKDLAAGLHQLETSCREFAHADLLSREEVAENLTEDAVRRMRKVNYLEVSRAEFLNEPVLISQSYYDIVLRTIVSET